MHPAIKQFQSDSDAAVAFLRKEMSSIHAGRATPSLVEHIKITAYDSVNELVHIASITTPDPRTIQIQPWDIGLIDSIVKSLTESRLGMNPVVRENVVLLSLPQLTGERRAELAKIISRKTEEANIKLRHAREKAKTTIESEEKNKTISEDEKFRFLKELEKLVSQLTGDMEKIESKKLTEIEG